MRRARILMLIAAATLASFAFGRPYDPWGGDNRLYVPAYLQAAYPGALARDFATSEPQTTMTVFDELLEAARSAAGTDVFVVIFVFTLLTRFAALWAVHALAIRLTRSGPAAALVVVLGAFGLPAAGPAIWLIELAAVPRSAAFAMGLWALAFAMRGRTKPAAAFLALAAPIHLPTVLLFAGMLGLKALLDRKFGAPAKVALAGVAASALAALAFGAGVGLFTRADTAWLDIIRLTNGQAFLSTWDTAAVWGLVVPVALLFLGMVNEGDPERRDLRKWYAAVGGGALLMTAFSFSLGEKAGFVLPLSLQFARSILVAEVVGAAWLAGTLFVWCRRAAPAAAKLSARYAVPAVAAALLAGAAIHPPAVAIQPAFFSDPALTELCAALEADGARLVDAPNGTHGPEIRMRCRIGVYFTRKDGAQAMFSRAYAEEWARRMVLESRLDLAGGGWKRLRAEGVTHYVLAKGQRPDLEPTWSNAEYDVYEVEAMAAEAARD